MKQLDLEITENKNRYQMHLGNGKFLTFDNKTQAKKHQLKLKRILRENVKMLNFIQPNINSLYRQSYFQLKQAEILEYTDKFHSYDERFDYIFKSFSSGNKNAFVFSNINNCYDLLIEITEKLHVFAQRYKNYSLLSQTSPIINHLKILQQSFNNDKRAILLNDLSKIKYLNPTKNEQFNTNHLRRQT